MNSQEVGLAPPLALVPPPGPGHLLASLPPRTGPDMLEPGRKTPVEGRGAAVGRSTRDPFLDVIRVAAVVLVVGQHWLMPVLASNGHTVETGNALATPGWWLLTWLSQVMPVVFFAGGAANLHSYRASGHPRAWLAGRLRRLVVPVLPLAAVWVVLPELLLRAGVAPQPVDVAGGISAQLLWFLVVYLVVVAVTPVMARAHERFGLGVLVPLAALAVLVDVVRFAGLPEAGFVNAVVIWVAVHQLGICYADGRLELGRRAHAAMAVGGFAVVAAMVAFGPYAPSMIGMPGAPMSNMSPPAAVLLPLAVGQLGLLLLARPVLNRLDGPAIRAVGARSTTIYLWHMPALVVVAGVMVLGMGYRTPEPGSVEWFAVAPMWVTCVGLVLAALVRVFGRFETGAGRAIPSATGVTAGFLFAATGLLGLTVRGFSPDGPNLFEGPVPWAVLVLTGVALCTRTERQSSRTPSSGWAVANPPAAYVTRPVALPVALEPTAARHGHR